MKKNNHNSYENPAEKGYKKSFLLRKIQEDEAEEEKRDYKYNDEREDDSRPSNV